VHAARRIAEGLTALGIAVLRSISPGSDRAKANSQYHVSSNVADLVRLPDELRRRRHARPFSSATAWAGRSARGGGGRAGGARGGDHRRSCDPDHVTGLFKTRSPQLGEHGEVAVKLGGREFRIRRAFLTTSPNKA